MVFHDKIQSAVQLKKRNRTGPEKCKLCEELESTNHIIFQCSIATFLWTFIKETLNLEKVPRSCSELTEEMMSNMSNKTRKPFLFMCACAMWALWKTRNDMVFNNKIVASPMVVAHKTISFMTQWKTLIKDKELEKMEAVINKLNEVYVKAT